MSSCGGAAPLPHPGDVRAVRRRDCGGRWSSRGGYGTRTCGEPSGRRCSATGEVRLPGTVLEEGTHAGLLVLAAEQVGEQPALQGEPVGDRHVQPLVDRLL